jgi:hydrogenase nickel incorporation protein HypA/HybF
MHEFSIAQALVELVRLKAPPGAVVRGVAVRAGPLRGLDAQAMQWAWQTAAREAGMEGAALALEELPWTLQCPDCGRQWTCVAMDTVCSCGSQYPAPVGGDELTLVSLDVDDAARIYPLG